MKKIIFILSSLLLFDWAASYFVDYAVLTSTEPSQNKEKDVSTNAVQNPILYEMGIQCNISNRFAKTLVVSKVKNGDDIAKETTFTVILPEKAFISKFTMEIGGKSYEAYVKEKEEAKNIYDQAVAHGQTAGHIAATARDSNRFTVSVNVEPESKAVFLLTYEELLERKNGIYELVLNIHPQQVVKNLNVKVNIEETRPLKFVKTPSLRSGNEISKNEEKLNPLSNIRVTNSTAVVTFNPDPESQKQFAVYLGSKESEGLSGQFVVQYDVERDPFGGEVLLQDGYFVHFFAPSELEPLPKHVLFTLDTSGSMGGERIRQLKDAMYSIINQTRAEDLISITEFSDEVNVWDVINNRDTVITYNYGEDYEEPFSKLSKLELPAPVIATEDNLSKARQVINKLQPRGSTNMIGGLESALYVARALQESTAETDKRYQPIIIFLTDGYPNGGVSSTDEIIRIVTRLNSKNNNVPIFSLSFGEGADKEFLRKLSLKNLGFSRHIYEDSDASLQLQEFFKEISSPLLANVTFKYNSEVKEVTKSNFPIFFKGSELVVAGRYEVGDATFTAPVSCFARDSPLPMTLTPTIGKPVSSLERLWAYLTVKDTLAKKDVSENKTELNKKALDLALKYSFVTDVTSLVVVKPNETVSTDTQAASKVTGGAHQALSPMMPHYGSSGFARTGSMPRLPNVYRSYLSYSPMSSYGSSLAHSPMSTYGSHLAHIPMSRPYGGAPMSFSPFSKAVSYDSDVDNDALISNYDSDADNNVHNSNNMYLPTFSTTTGIPTTSSSIDATLPWLSTALNPNGTLSVSSGIYELGENSTKTGHTRCPETPFNDGHSGICIHLKDCLEVHDRLTSFHVYEKYFCPFENRYAGVCCPRIQNIRIG